MSARTDLVREALLGPFDPQKVLDGSTPNATIYASSTGTEIKGREAIAEALTKFFSANQPKFRLEADPIEHGDIVIAFAADDANGETLHTCNVYCFEGDKIAGCWVIRS